MGSKWDHEIAITVLVSVGKDEKGIYRVVNNAEVEPQFMMNRDGSINFPVVTASDYVYAALQTQKGS